MLTGEELTAPSEEGDMGGVFFLQENKRRAKVCAPWLSCAGQVAGASDGRVPYEAEA